MILIGKLPSANTGSQEMGRMGKVNLVKKKERYLL